MRLNGDDYRGKVLGCWLGKNVGGTIGAPFEWRRQLNGISFYTQPLKGDPMPNDDLDIQLVWLVALEERGIELTSRTLADYWCLYVTPHWAEYGTGKVNMRSGLLPPCSGTLHNAYKHSCGSYIRSEIWACIAPGLPHVAARYAYEDAILDHGDGEGVYAEVFMASLESAAFLVGDLRKLIEIGLSFIPADCGVAKAVRTTLKCFDSKMTWQEARDEILRQHRGRIYHVSPEDRQKGFHEGTVGYDVPSNIGMTLVGLLYGAEDFGKVVCTAVNCGEDTDCTAATAGSVWGIIHGAQAIPQRWLDPIGRGIKTVCCNLGELGYFGSQLPQTVDELTDRTARIASQVLRRHGAVHLQSEEPTDLGDLNADALKCADSGTAMFRSLGGPRFDFDFFTVSVDYGEGPLIRDGQPKLVRLAIQNTYKVQANLSLHWYVPEGWRVLPSADGYAMSLPGWFGTPLELEFQLVAERLTRTMNRAVLEITIEGRPTVMLVPIHLLNGNCLGR
jgi:ADP-ribosylglycohydrolase